MHVGEKETWDQSLERRVINSENESQLLGNWKEQVPSRINFLSPVKNVKYQKTTK
jgi:hypothetical protein